MSEYYESATNWKFVKQLGSGAFGKVNLWNKSGTNEFVAIKTCFVRLDQLASDERTKLKTRWEEESATLMQIAHENLVRACPDLCPELVEEQNQLVKLPIIVMEYCDGGNLRTKLEQIENKNGLSEYEVRQVLRALQNAVLYLHDLSITHRDIKPENIIIKYGQDGRPIYKLTDMGYARILADQTIAGSMVGTRNYFAPEIVVNGKYKNSVDYWSIGIVAFEISCGAYPFLQSGTVYEALNSIKTKPTGCIAITKSDDGEIRHHTELFPENRLSVVFRRLIEQWLQLALEYDGRKRGNRAFDDAHLQKPELEFHTKLDAALDANIFTVYWLNKSKFLSYCIDMSTTMDSLYSAMEQDTCISRDKFKIISPAGHAFDYMISKTSPLHFYDEKFAVEDKPMAYLVDIVSGSNAEDPLISETIQILFAEELSEPQITLNFNQCLKNALFIYQNELKRIVEFVNGIREFAMWLEDRIMSEERSVNKFNENLVHCNGQLKQYEDMLAKGREVLEENLIRNTEPTDNKLENIVQKMKSLLDEGLNDRRQKILKSTRDILAETKLDKRKEELITQVTEFENFFSYYSSIPNEEFVKLLPSKSNLNNEFKKLLRPKIKNFFRLRLEVLRNTEKFLKINETGNNACAATSKVLLIDIANQFHDIQNKVNENQLFLANYGQWLTNKTKEYMENFRKFVSEDRNIIERMDTLDLDYSRMPSSLTGDSPESIFEVPTMDIIAESEKLQQALLQSFWTPNGKISLP